MSWRSEGAGTAVLARPARRVLRGRRRPSARWRRRTLLRAIRSTIAPSD